VVEYDGQPLGPNPNQAAGGPLAGAVRDVVVVPAGGCRTVSVCFDADNPGIWPLHCHMTYHMAAGMFTTVEYEQGAALGAMTRSNRVPATPAPACHNTTTTACPSEVGFSASLLAAATATGSVTTALAMLAVVWVARRGCCCCCRRAAKAALSGSGSERGVYVVVPGRGLGDESSATHSFSIDDQDL
jgi:hypothetical protein